MIVGEPGCVWGERGSVVPAAVVGDLLHAVAPSHVAVQRGLVFDLSENSKKIIKR